MEKIYCENEQFFKKIDSEEKAYVLGFFFADGCNHDMSKYNDYNQQNIISFTQIEQDLDILDQVKEALECNRPYKILEPYGNRKRKYTLCIVSNSLSKDLINLGAVPNKSLILEFPTKVPEKYMNHFIRGYFDGDGCIWNGKRKKMIVKDSKCKSGFRERIVHNVKFTFTGSIPFITELQEYLVTRLNFNKTKLNFKKEHRYCTMEYSGRKNIKKLFDYMYKDASIYGSRKYNKFLEIFCASKEKSLEDISLIAGTPEMVISSEASNIEERSSTIPEMGIESSDSKYETPNEKVEGEDIVSSTIK